jgi:hypothetical protein
MNSHHIEVHPRQKPQDNATAVHLQAAQMKVQADHLYRLPRQYAQPSKIIPFIQPSQASLTIDGETITEDMRTDCVKRPAA